jgi:hypothetical protein
MTACGRLCEFDVVPASRQKLILWMAQRQLSEVYSQRQPPARSAREESHDDGPCVLAMLNDPAVA